MAMPNGSNLGRWGLLIDKKILQSEYRFDVMLESGKMLNGVPERYIEAVNKELTDDQLEQVRGGMCAQRFSNWRAEKLNEGR
tara:strand:- start:210 stop:455 length:246 start_codon:yes stop_codon:yes gene_type:complete